MELVPFFSFAGSTKKLIKGLFWQLYNLRKGYVFELFELRKF